MPVMDRPVADRTISLSDPNSDDLPRTFRRQRDEQQRAHQQAMVSASSHDAEWAHDHAPTPAVVTAFKVPFFRLMLFYIKAVVAAIPAIILLIAILWGLGHLLTTYLPWLVKVQILIRIPN